MANESTQSIGNFKAAIMSICFLFKIKNDTYIYFTGYFTTVLVRCSNHAKCYLLYHSFVVEAKELVEKCSSSCFFFLQTRKMRG